MAKHNKEYYFEQIRQNLNNDERFAKDFEWIKNMVKEYSEKLGLSEADVVESMESKRTYWSANYYQEHNFPNLKDVVIFDNMKQFYNYFPSKKYRCTSCNEMTANPNMCDECGFKTYGLFRPDGTLRCAFKEDFLNNPVVYDIYPPIELDHTTIKEYLNGRLESV